MEEPHKGGQRPLVSLSVTTWNLGYGGLGRGSDFVVDGGRHWLPPSRKAVKANVAAICRWVSQRGDDVLLLQEVASAGFANFWVDLRRRLSESLAGRFRTEYADLKVRGFLPPLRLTHGVATFSLKCPVKTETWPLPNDGDYSSGWLAKRYAALVTRFEIPGRDRHWAVVNLHLAAFDTDGQLRRRQLAEVVRRAVAEAASGGLVVIGGDWNMRLAKTRFTSTTRPEHLAWLVDFDPAVLPQGWIVACDETRPTVRTNERPYSDGENYRAIIDGFVVGPGVVLDEIQACELGFEHSDHHPVSAVFHWDEME